MTLRHKLCIQRYVFHTLFTCILFLSIYQSGVLYTGGEDRGITAWDLSSGKVSSRIESAHAARLKGIVAFDSCKNGSELSNLVASASSDGVIRVWDVRTMGNAKSTPLAEANTKARLTCLAGTSLKCKSWTTSYREDVEYASQHALSWLF
jgi:protein MAK11